MAKRKSLVSKLNLLIVLAASSVTSDTRGLVAHLKSLLKSGADHSGEYGVRSLTGPMALDPGQPNYRSPELNYGSLDPATEAP